jgi:hypothetical protein
MGSLILTCWEGLTTEGTGYVNSFNAEGAELQGEVAEKTGEGGAE